MDGRWIESDYQADAELRDNQALRFSLWKGGIEDARQVLLRKEERTSAPRHGNLPPLRRVSLYQPETHHSGNAECVVQDGVRGWEIQISGSIEDTLCQRSRSRGREPLYVDDQAGECTTAVSRMPEQVNQRTEQEEVRVEASAEARASSAA